MLNVGVMVSYVWSKVLTALGAHPPLAKVSRVVAFNEDQRRGETYVEYFRNPGDVDVSWKRFRVEVRYTFGDKKFRAVYHDRVPTDTIPPKHMGSAMAPRLVEAWLVHSTAAQATDVTARVRKYMGPNRDFHGSNELHVRLWDMLPFNDHESDPYEALVLTLSDGRTIQFEYAANPIVTIPERHW
jgi:hypothetical protein